ncbi:MAG: hypothetical protein AAGG38_01010 [Planctomycetota bacterium]
MARFSVFSLGCCLVFASAVTASAGPSLPPDSEYVQVVDGHLSVNGERQRYWAAIGQLYGKSGFKKRDSPEVRKEKVARARRGTDYMVQRFTDLGFNAVRLWDGFASAADSRYEIGDGSKADNADYFLMRAKEAGFKVWLAGTNRLTDARAEDVKIIPVSETGRADAQAWAEAVTSMAKYRKNGKFQHGWKLSGNLARSWDERIEKLALRDMTRIATHRNKYTGLRWCDDPVFAVWELSNEEWWMLKMLGGKWQQYPAYFRNKLIAKWNDFLLEKYGTPEALAQAWGELLDGESLNDGTILLAPMRGKTSVAASINDANVHAEAALSSLEQEYGRDDFAPQRASDVIEFLLDIHMARKQREAQVIKSLGKSTRLSPLIFDTGIGYEIQSQFMHQAADAVAHDAYINGTGPRTMDKARANIEAQTTEHQRKRLTLEYERLESNDGPWVNWLLKPPGISQGVPWLEHNRVEGKPFLAYETQIQQPAKYRADYPLRLAALAAIQDWDWICWHYFGDTNLTTRVGAEARPFDSRMDISTGGHPQGYHFTYDEVQNAMMRAAGHMFRNFAHRPAPNPTKFIYGREALHDPASMDYGGSYGDIGLDMLQTVYQYGVRIEIDPDREDNQVIGPVVEFEDRHTHNPYTPTQEITFDWKKGHMVLDSDSAVGWAGLMGHVGDHLTFSSSVTLSDVTIDNPEGIYSPVGDEKYIAFSLYSQDGQPLASAQRIGLSLMSTSFNTGFAPQEPGKRGRWIAGDTPVLVARVGGTIESPYLDGMAYTLRDWHMKKIGQGVVRDGRFEFPIDKPVFVVEFERQTGTAAR